MDSSVWHRLDSFTIEQIFAGDVKTTKKGKTKATQLLSSLCFYIENVLA
jgi:hypothetical protein